MHNALKPAGLLFLGMKTGEGLSRDDLGRRYTYYSQARLTELLAAARFEVIDTQTGEAMGLAGNIDPFVLMTFKAS